MAETVVQGLSADASRIPSKWNRQTVADGDWLQKKTLAPLSARDVYLAEQIDKGNSDVTYVSGKVDELSGKTLVLSGELNSTSSFLSGAIDSVSAGVDFVSAGVDSVSSIFDDFYTNEYEQFVRDVTQSANDLDGKIDDVAGDLADEIVNRTNADIELQNQIDKLEAATDVICVYGTYSGSENSFSNASGDLFKEPEHLTENDVIKILNDNSDTGEGGQTYWQATNVDWETSSCDWTRIGKLDPYYTKSEINTITANIESDISNTYLSAKGAVHQGKNIVVTEDSTKPEITISTSADVEFTTVTSVGFSGTNISGATKKDTIDNLFGSAYSGAAASAWVSANSASLDIQPGYGLETGTNENGNKVIGIRQDHCDYAAYGLALGKYSTAQGAVNGPNAFAFGDYCYAHGANAFAAGCHSTAGKFAVAMGYYNVATGDYSLALGYNSTADRAYSVVIGQGLSGNGSITLGKFNEYVEDAQFVVGDGSDRGYDVTARKNILVIKNDKVSAADFSAGNVSLSSLTNISALGNGITNTATFNLSAVKLSAGQGIGFKDDTNGVLSITAEGTTYNAGDYISTANKTIAVTGNLITSANAGSAASAWINTNKTKIAYSADFKGSNNVITGYGTSSFAGGISSISVGNTVFTGRDVKFSAGDNILFTTADNKLSINVYNNLSLGESESKRIFTLTTEDVIGADGPGIFIDNVPETQVQIYNNKIYRNGKSTTWDKVISAGNGNFVSAANNQTLALASATTAITPATMSNNIIYLV